MNHGYVSKMCGFLEKCGELVTRATEFEADAIAETRSKSKPEKMHMRATCIEDTVDGGLKGGAGIPILRNLKSSEWQFKIRSANASATSGSVRFPNETVVTAYAHTPQLQVSRRLTNC